MPHLTRDWSVHPVRLRNVERLQYLRVRADEGAIGLGRRVSVWLENTWRAATVTDAWDANGAGGGTVWLHLMPWPIP